MQTFATTLQPLADRGPCADGA